MKLLFSVVEGAVDTGKVVLVVLVGYIEMIT